MGRWEPDARGRVMQAALELFGERGFEQTTVAEIAGRAGLTERTFFRHFADKREVLFAGTDALRELLVSTLANAPAAAAPINSVVAALATATAPLQERRDYARRRQAVIVANAELRERELIKLASWAAALAETLRRRGVPGTFGEPHRRGGHRHLQDRLRALDRRTRRTVPAPAHPQVARRAEDRDRRRLSAPGPGEPEAVAGWTAVAGRGSTAQLTLQARKSGSRSSVARSRASRTPAASRSAA